LCLVHQFMPVTSAIRILRLLNKMTGYKRCWMVENLTRSTALNIQYRKNDGTAGFLAHNLHLSNGLSYAIIVVQFGKPYDCISQIGLAK